MKKIIISFMLFVVTFCFAQTEVINLEKDLVNWEKIESANFVIYFQHASVVFNKNKFSEAHERVFLIINRVFNSKLPNKISMFVFNSDDDARKYGIPQLGFANPEECKVFKKANQTIGHEITHVISYYVTDHPLRTRFVNEGTATAFNFTKDNKLEVAKKMKEIEKYENPISIREAWESPDKYPEWVYYPLAGELMRRLLEIKGKEKFVQLMADQTYFNAKKIYGNSLESIIDYLEKQIN